MLQIIVVLISIAIGIFSVVTSITKILEEKNEIPSPAVNVVLSPTPSVNESSQVATPTSSPTIKIVTQSPTPEVSITPVLTVTPTQIIPTAVRNLNQEREDD